MEQREVLTVHALSVLSCGLDDLDGVLCVQRGLKFKPEQGRDLHSGDKTRVFVVFV